MKRGRREKPVNRYLRLAWACQVASTVASNPLLKDEMLEAKREFEMLADLAENSDQFALLLKVAEMRRSDTEGTTEE